MGKTFEFDGGKYQKASTHQKEWGNSLIGELCLSGGETILDLGCGDGALTEQLADAVPAGKVLGIDASAGMIQTAAQHVRGNLAFQKMDINRMDFQEEFDVIFSNAALHWVKDHEKLLASAQCALKEGGVILWDFAGDGNCANFFAVIREIIERPQYRQCFRDFVWPWYMPRKSEYERLIFSAGFSEYCVTEVNRDRYFPSADAMIGWIDQPSIVPFIGQLPEEVREEFRQDVIRSMLARTRQADGTCFETFRRIHVTARK